MRHKIHAHFFRPPFLNPRRSTLPRGVCPSFLGASRIPFLISKCSYVQSLYALFLVSLSLWLPVYFYPFLSVLNEFRLAILQLLSRR